MEFDQDRVKDEPVFDHIYFVQQDPNIEQYEPESTMKGSSDESIWDKMFQEDFLKLIKNEPRVVNSNTKPILTFLVSVLNNPPLSETDNNHPINETQIEASSETLK